MLEGGSDDPDVCSICLDNIEGDGEVLRDDAQQLVQARLRLVKTPGEDKRPDSRHRATQNRSYYRRSRTACSIKPPCRGIVEMQPRIPVPSNSM